MKKEIQVGHVGENGRLWSVALEREAVELIDSLASFRAVKPERLLWTALWSGLEKVAREKVRAENLGKSRRKRLGSTRRSGFSRRKGGVR